MELQKKIVITNSRGIHARTAAMITSFVNKINKKYDVRLYIQKENQQSKIPIASMLALTALSIKKDDIVTIYCKGKNPKEAIKELECYLSGDIDKKINDIEEFDRVLAENTVSINSELESVKEIKDKFVNILKYVSDGICLMNDKGTITYINPSYEKIWGVKSNDILGKNAMNIYSNRPSVHALKTKSPVLDIVIHGDKDKQIISNSTPIIVDGVFRGVISSYNDISGLKDIMHKLDFAQEKIKYYEEELTKKNTDFGEAFSLIIGKSSMLQDSLAIALKAAKTSATVLIRGESGTGKELVAKAIHDSSNRSAGPFIKLNCAAIPENLLESELFGHEKGSFTSAYQRKIGKFELANGGTLFLDEIGEISYNIQAKLLRALQEKEFERVGGNAIIKTNIRIIAATNRNLEEMVKNNSFREDLYYRLNVIPIMLPPIRDRKADIPMLVEHFLRKSCNEENIPLKTISAEALKCLCAYYWPGNVRELENIIIRSVTLSEENEIKPENLPIYIQNLQNNNNNNLINLRDGDLCTLEEYEKEIIKLALEKYKSFNKAAKALGVTHRTVSLKAKKYNIN